MRYPMKLKAPLKDYIWGGTKLKTEYGKVSDLPRIAESWELSCHRDGCSIIENGPEAGKTLYAYLEEQKALGQDLVGTRAAHFPAFPILVKLIDAKEQLSVQVHPDDAYAMEVEGEYGKTEMWYVAECEPDSYLYYGFQTKISREEFLKRIQNHTILDVCQKIPIKKGDIFFIEPGIIHAIGKGVVIAEIQQSSNSTYRIYDYDRVDANGQKRELHVEKAVEVTRLVPPISSRRPLRSRQAREGYKDTLLASCPYFTVYLYDIQTHMEQSATEETFQSLLVLTGSLTLKYAGSSMELQKGDSIFIPAGFGNYEITGTGTILVSEVT